MLLELLKPHSNILITKQDIADDYMESFFGEEPLPDSDDELEALS